MFIYLIYNIHFHSLLKLILAIDVSKSAGIMDKDLMLCCENPCFAQINKTVSLFIVQCYLFAYFSMWRNIKSFLAFALICLCNMYLYELRNIWQILFHVTVGAFITLQIHLRQPQGKAPDYNVWAPTHTHTHIHKTISMHSYIAQSPEDWMMMWEMLALHFFWTLGVIDHQTNWM